MIGDAELQRRLKVIWLNESEYRFIPRSLDGGPGWGVWDKKRGRFLKNKEIKRLSFDDCIEKWMN